MDYKTRQGAMRSFFRALLLMAIIIIGLSVVDWNHDRIRRLKSLEAMEYLKEEVEMSRAALEKSVDEHIKVKEASVKLLSVLESGNADIKELDRLDWLARRNFRLRFSQRLIRHLIPACHFYDFGADSLMKMCTVYPDMLDEYRNREITAQSFYNNHFRPFLISTLPLYEEAGEKQREELYTSMVYRNLVKEKMELTIEVLYQGAIAKKYAEHLALSLENSLREIRGK